MNTETEKWLRQQIERTHTMEKTYLAYIDEQDRIVTQSQQVALQYRTDLAEQRALRVGLEALLGEVAP